MDQHAPGPSVAAQAAGPKMSPGLKLALEMGPLALFLIANFRPKWFEPLLRPVLPVRVLEGKDAGLITATAVLMIAVLVALAISYAKLRRLPTMPVVTAILVLVFGGLTIYFHDQRFIQIKVTVLYAAFGLVLLGGLAMKRPLLPIVLDSAMSLTETGWSILTFRWGLFFLFLAGLNEVMRAVLTWDQWLFFKFPGTLVIIFLFTFTQVPLIMRHELKGEAAEETPEHV